MLLSCLVHQKNFHKERNDSDGLDRKLAAGVPRSVDADVSGGRWMDGVWVDGEGGGGPMKGVLPGSVGVFRHG